MLLLTPPALGTEQPQGSQISSRHCSCPYLPQHMDVLVSLHRLRACQYPASDCTHRSKPVRGTPREEGSFLWLPWKANQNVECSSTKPPETKYVESAVFIYITQFFFARAVTWLVSTWLHCIVIQKVQQVSAGEYKMLNLLIAREAADTSIPPETQTHLAK